MVVPVPAEYFLFSLMSAASLLLYSRTCRQAHQAVKSYMRHTFNLNDALAPYFKPQEILLFRYWQWQCGMLISGSTALRFFNRVPFSDVNKADSDLDLYVELRFCKPIAEWLMSIGYVFERRTRKTPATFAESLQATNPLFIDFLGDSIFYGSSERPYIGRGIANVFNFWRNGRKIQLIASDSCPLEIILNFHSTCVMSIVTYAKAYCLYPKGTFEERRSLLHSTQGTNQETAIRKYRKRGWEMVSGMPSKEDRENLKSAFPACKRFVGDGKCWTIALNPVMPFGQTQIGITMSNYIEANSWELCYADESNKFKAEMRFYNLSSTRFKFRYMIANLELADYVQMFFGNDSEDTTDAAKAYKDGDLRMLVRWKLVNAINPDD